MRYTWRQVAFLGSVLVSGCGAEPAADGGKAGAGPGKTTASAGMTARAGSGGAGVQYSAAGEPAEEGGAGARAEAGGGAGGKRAAEGGKVAIIPANGEVCDGTDNDGNGLVDDADVEGDGVCDCLKIASIGREGAFGGEGELAFRDWPNARAQNHVVPLEGAVITDELLAPYDVLIVLNVSTGLATEKDTPHHAFTDAEAAAFQRWVRAGGGAVTTGGYTADQEKEVVNVNKVISPFGLGYSPSKLGLNGMITSWQAHPVTAGITRVFTEVGSEPDGAAAQTLAVDGNAHVALQVPKTDSARVLAWGDEWITYASQWQSQADQQVERFWVNALTWLSRPTSCQQRITKK